MGDGQQRQQKTMQNQQVNFDKRVPTKEVQNDVFMNLALSICNLRLSPAKKGSYHAQFVGLSLKQRDRLYIDLLLRVGSCKLGVAATSSRLICMNT